MNRFSHWGFVLLSIVLTALSVQCHEDDDSKTVTDPETTQRHTLLVYIAGDNSLSRYADPNIRLMQQGLLQRDSTLNLIIFNDNYDLVRSQLYELRAHEGKIDTTIIATFDTDLNSADAAVMRQVVNLAFTHSETELNGLVLWSHAMSWIPSENYSSSPAQRAPAYFGQDGSSYMELWDMHDALADGPHLDYILVDACFFSTAEVAYELRDVTDYLVAAPTEVFGTGYPYQNVLPILDEMTADNREEVLTRVVKAFQEEYVTNGTLTLTRTAGMSTLAKQWADSREKYPEVWASIAANPVDWHERLQRYGRRRVGAYYYYYDFADLLEQVAAEAGHPETIDVSEAVVYEYHSSLFTDYYEPLPINTCCGIGVSVPELFQLATNATKLSSAYTLTQWGKETPNLP
jgi:hypothetical protein